jgi:hypothetical protein
MAETAKAAAKSKSSEGASPSDREGAHDGNLYDPAEAEKSAAARDEALASEAGQPTE